MSKKKNTLNDLEEFLKMQASALVTPPPIAESVKPIAAPSKAPEPRPIESTPVVSAPSATVDIVEALQNIAARDKKEFYDILIKTAASLPNGTREDALLINTALYLKGGSKWKEVVKNYWKGRS